MSLITRSNRLTRRGLIGSVRRVAVEYQAAPSRVVISTRKVVPAGMGSPAVISQSLMGTGQVLLSHVVIFNAAFATIQLGLGAGLFGD